MVPKRWVVSASPLILLGKIDEHAGRIEKAAPIIERLRETGLYVTEGLVQQILREVGE